MKDLTKGKILPVILKFSLPILIGNLFNLAYNLADIRIIGGYLGETALASVGSVSTFSDLLVGFSFGLANGFAVLTARFYGMKDEKAVKKSFALSIELGVIISALLMLLSHFGLDLIFNWLNIEAKYAPRAASYINIIIYGLIFNCLYNVCASSLRAIGDAYTPLFFLILSAILNIFLDILCVGKLNMDVAGAGIATVIAQFISMVLCVIYINIRYPIFRFGFKELLPEKHAVRELLAGGFSMGLMSCLVSFGTVSLQTAINKLGEGIIVAHTATRKLSNIFMTPFGVLGTAMATFSGQNYGANQYGRIKEGIKKVLLLAFAWVVLVIIATWTVAPMLIRAITAVNDPEIIGTAVLYQKFDTAFYALIPMIAVLRNSLQGMGDHVTPVISSGLELLGKVLIAYLLTPILEYWGIIVAEPVVWIIMVIPLIISMVKRLKKC